MMLMMHGSPSGVPAVEVIQGASGLRSLTSLFTKTATVTFSAAPSAGEVLLFLYYRSHQNSLASETPPAGLTTHLTSNMSNVYNYPYCTGRIYSKLAGNYEPSSYTFSYNSTGNGLMYIRGYRLANANRVGIIAGSRTQQSVNSQVVPAATLNAPAGSASFLYHSKRNTNAPSVNNGFDSQVAMWSWYLNAWHQLHGTANASLDATVSWATATLASGMMVVVPAKAEGK